MTGDHQDNSANCYTLLLSELLFSAGMAHLLFHYCLYLLLLSPWPVVHGLFEWLRETESEPPAAAQAPAPVSASASASPASPASPAAPAAPASPAPGANHVQFEMALADDKFLAEAKQMELSPLDTCHQRVIEHLKSSCEGLSEQQLAKLGVALFNCQAESEGRRTYPCIEDMTIQECTAAMDPDTWNAYHIVSNRARAVCYATRQTLFRRRAEHTVNSLLSTASSQLHAMMDLKEGQLELRRMTSASLDKVLEGHSALQAKQSKLYEEQEQMETSMRDNMERLVQEKALIASGQEQVAQLMHIITDRLEGVSEHLQTQSSSVQDSHNAIVEDLADVRHKAQDIYHKIDSSMTEFTQYQDQTSQYYSDLMSKLERMNSTLGFVLHYLDNMQNRLEQRLHVVQRYLGWAGLSLAAMWTCMAHAGYFVLGAILLAFLGGSGFSRAMLLFTVPLNAVAEVNQQPALDLCSLSLLLLTLSLGNWITCQMWFLFHHHSKVTAPLSLDSCGVVEPETQVSDSPSYPPSSTPQRKQNDELSEKKLHDQDGFLSDDFGISMVSPCLKRELGEGLYKNYLTPRALVNPVLPLALIDDFPAKSLEFEAGNDVHDFVSDSRSASPSPSIISNSSLSGRVLCNAVTKAGKPCRKRAVLGQEFCRVHEGGHSSYVKLT